MINAQTNAGCDFYLAVRGSSPVDINFHHRDIANGMAQQQRRDWRDSSHFRAASKNALLVGPRPQQVGSHHQAHRTQDSH